MDRYFSISLPYSFKFREEDRSDERLMAGQFLIACIHSEFLESANHDTQSASDSKKSRRRPIVFSRTNVFR